MDDLAELKLLRSKILEITETIITLANERQELARRVGVVKRRLGMSVEDHEVEDQLKKDIVRLCEEKGIDVELGLRLLLFLVEEAKKAQEEGKPNL